MNIENPSSPIEIPDKYELLKKYAERGDLFEGLHKPEKEYLNLSDETLSQIVESIDFSMEDTERNTAKFILKAGVSPMTLKMKNSRLMCSLDIDFDKFSKEESIACFDLSVKDTEIGEIVDLYHREVEPDFRGGQTESGMSLANFSMQIIEKILENRALRLNTPQRIVVGTAQIDVMYWLFNNRFHILDDSLVSGITKHDFYLGGEEKWRMISSIDERLFIGENKFCYSRKDVPESHIQSAIERDESTSIGIIFSKDIPVPNPAEETRKRLKQFKV